MRHTSIKLNTPIEIVNTTKMNPLISKCEIKVCYVGDDPNRNGTVITKDLAVELAQTLPGSPIVGFYDEELGDFLGHEKELSFDEEGNLYFKELTRPYGFIDSQAKVWFQKFLDDGVNEREYLMTEGYLWTGQYPECQRVITEGNNQSMELDPESARITRAEKVNPKEVFFIINEAIISKLCILGQETEPCFEGADIKAPQIQFSFEEDFKTRFFSMMEELKTIMSKGGETMSEVVLENEIVEEETEVVLENEVVEEEEIVVEEEVIETQDNSDETDSNNFEKNTEDDEEEEEEICPDCGKPVSKCICKKYEALQQDYETLQSNYSALETEVVGLREFKASAERKEKTKLINSFYMLSEEDKADVVANIDNYSLEDIEGKLSVICVRNKVSFAEETAEEGISYNLNDTQEDEVMPAWVKAAKAVRDSK